MKRTRTGFTLIELLVVVLIIGILGAMGVPQYMKTVATSRATAALGLTQMIANAQRMCLLDNPTNQGLCTSAKLDANHYLVQHNYISNMDWAGSDYDYYSCNGGCGCGGNGVACAISTRDPYIASWGYVITTTGGCTELGASTPKCPKM